MATQDDVSRASRQVRGVLWTVLALNIVIALAKLGYGHATSTLTLIADGYHSLLDSTSNVVGLVGVTLGAAMPDEDHPYGHRKFEVLSGMAVSMFIFYSAFAVLSEAWGRVSGAHQEIPHVDVWSFAIALGTLGVNVFVTRFEQRRGRELSSPFLIADAAHTWSDVVVTLAVLLGLALTRFVHPMADVGLAVVVGAFLVRAGYQVLMSGAQVVADRVVFQPEEIERVVRPIEGVLGCARIRTRGLPQHAFLDMVVLVAPDATVARAHELADKVEARLAEAFPGLRDIVIHIEPAPAPTATTGATTTAAAEQQPR